MIKIATWNIEHFNDYFREDNMLMDDELASAKFAAISRILKEFIQADLIGITEAPNTTTTTGIQDVVAKLENFAAVHGLTTTKAIAGFPSAGKQELAFLYDPRKLTLEHKPEGTDSLTTNPRFDGVFHFDADDDKLKEVYKHYRPPLEVKVTINGAATGMGNDEELWMMLVHAKSKGIFNSVDQVHLERVSRRNRLKLYAECTWIRQRVESWLKKDRKVVVMGDINDGPGMDVYEMRYGRSAVEVIIGDIFAPDKLLYSPIGRPTFGKYGWKPASASFRDRITEDYINVLIDHILVSQDIRGNIGITRVWNPYQAPEGDPIRTERDLFRSASDHFPISMELNY